jgi:hypothetical protein
VLTCPESHHISTVYGTYRLQTGSQYSPFPFSSHHVSSQNNFRYECSCLGSSYRILEACIIPAQPKLSYSSLFHLRPSPRNAPNALASGSSFEKVNSRPSKFKVYRHGTRKLYSTLTSWLTELYETHTTKIILQNFDFDFHFSLRKSL